MNFEISEKKLNQVKESIQKLLDSELDLIRELSIDWGLGEMGDLAILDSVEKIEIDRIVPYTKIKVYVNIYSNSNQFDKIEYHDLRAELQYRMEEWFPNIQLYIDELIHV